MYRGATFLRCPECGKRGVYWRSLATNVGGGAGDEWRCRYCPFETGCDDWRAEDVARRAAIRTANPGKESEVG